jgi:hypothetical protein
MAESDGIIGWADQGGNPILASYTLPDKTTPTATIELGITPSSGKKNHRKQTCAAFFHCTNFSSELHA